MRNYEDVVIVFFLRRVLDLDSDPSFSEIALDLAHLVFSSPLDYSHFREGNGDRKGKRKKKRREKKEKIRFVASRKLHLSLGIIYRKYYLSNETFFATGTGISFAFSRIDRISVQNDKILPGNVCSVRSYCFRQFFNNNYASKLLNNGTGFLLFFKTPPFFFALEEIHDVCAARNPWHFCNPPWMLFFTQIIPPVFFIPLPP